MPSFPLKWLMVLFGVFLVSCAADLYLSRPGSLSAGSATAVQLNAEDFLGSAAAGELAAGTIIYRVNGAGLADLAATRTHLGETANVKTTARLTDERRCPSWRAAAAKLGASATFTKTESRLRSIGAYRAT